jgi:hypothetical protein
MPASHYRRSPGRKPAEAPVPLRLKVYLTRGRLDRQIAEGRPCGATAELALRAGQLTHPRMRQGVARNLRGLVDYVDTVGSRVVISAVVIDRAAVNAGREAILGLAERLEGSAPATAGGIVRVRRLLADGRSPFYNPDCERTVAEAIWDVVDELGTDPPATGFDAVAA